MAEPDYVRLLRLAGGIQGFKGPGLGSIEFRKFLADLLAGFEFPGAFFHQMLLPDGAFKESLNCFHHLPPKVITETPYNLTSVRVRWFRSVFHLTALMLTAA